MKGDLEALDSKWRIGLVSKLGESVRKRVGVAHSVVECALNSRAWGVSRVIFDVEEDGVIGGASASTRNGSGCSKFLLMWKVVGRARQGCVPSQEAKLACR